MYRLTVWGLGFTLFYPVPSSLNLLELFSLFLLPGHTRDFFLSFGLDSRTVKKGAYMQPPIYRTYEHFKPVPVAVTSKV